MSYVLCLLMSLSFLTGPEQVVKNEQAVKGKGVVLSFEENLRLGPDDDEEYLIWQGGHTSVGVGEKGQMYVLDPAGVRVIELDAEGNFVRQIGKQGQGPGEFLKPTNLSILADGSVVVSEYRFGSNLITHFNEKGHFLRSISATDGYRMFGAQLSRNGKFYAGGYLSSNTSALDVGQGVLNLERKPVAPLVSKVMPDIDGARFTDPNYWVEFLAAWFQLLPAQGLVSMSHDGAIFTAKTSEYKITRYDGEMKANIVIEKAYKPKPLKEEELEYRLESIHAEVLASLPPQVSQIINESVIKRAVKKAELPPVQSPILALIATGDGGVLAVTDYQGETRVPSADYFDAKGKLIGQFELPPVDLNFFGGHVGNTIKMTMVKDQAYVLEYDDGDYSLVRYKVAKK